MTGVVSRPNDAHMNYGETLSYWYLRLNGFFPLKNFVMHMPRAQHSDCDILAVRFPGVSEDVGGQADDWDKPRFERWRVSLDAPIVLVVQVKTGTARRPGKAFQVQRLQYAIRRVGLWDRASAEQLAERLVGEAFVPDERATVAKLLIASQPAEDRTYLSMKLDEAVEFIEGRFRRYAPAKGGGRLFFNDELIQFFGHQAGLRQVADDEED